MRILMFAVLSLLAASTLVVAADYMPRELLVTTHGGVGNSYTESRFREMNIACGTKVERTLFATARGTSYLLNITDGRSVEDAISCWLDFPETRSARPNYILKLIP